MNLHHVALNIRSEEETVDFYQNILGFHFEYQFNMPTELGAGIFGINKPLKVFLYKKHDIILELFVHSANPDIGFSHICLETKERDKLAEKCENCGYPATRIKRSDKPDLLFIKDNAGNIFELKEGTK